MTAREEEKNGESCRRRRATVVQKSSSRGEVPLRTASDPTVELTRGRDEEEGMIDERRTGVSPCGGVRRRCLYIYVRTGTTPVYTVCSQSIPIVSERYRPTEGARILPSCRRNVDVVVAVVTSSRRELNVRRSAARGTEARRRRSYSGRLRRRGYHLIKGAEISDYYTLYNYCCYNFYYYYYYGYYCNYYYYYLNYYNATRDFSIRCMAKKKKNE